MKLNKQYRKLALKFHPDRNQYADAEEHFKEISEAYAVISDSKKKQAYDQYGHAGLMEDILVKISFKEHTEEDLPLMMYWDGVTKAVLCIFLVNTMKQSNVMIKQ